MADPWYHDGLRFECTRCGACCTGEPGYVWVTPEELAAVAEFLRTPVEEARAAWTRPERGRLTLRERANGDCVFYDRTAGCTVYAVRPMQCRTWPFWESTAATPARWERTARACPGIGRGELIPAEEITRRIRAVRV